MTDRSLSLLSALALASGCYDTKGDTGYDDPSGGLWDEWDNEDGEDGEDDPGWYDETAPDTVTPAPDTWDTKPNPYSSYEGWESMSYRFGEGEAEPGEYTCQLVWEAVGFPFEAIPSNCPDCEFLFDVRLGYDAGAYEGLSYDDGTCAKIAEDRRYVYGYSSAYDAVVIGYEGYFYPWSYDSSAEFDGETFRYGRGYKDYDLSGYGYEGYFYTYYWYGYAEIR